MTERTLRVVLLAPLFVAVVIAMIASVRDPGLASSNGMLRLESVMVCLFLLLVVFDRSDRIGNLAMALLAFAGILGNDRIRQWGDAHHFSHVRALERIFLLVALGLLVHAFRTQRHAKLAASR